jgi:hypothetical protein
MGTHSAERYPPEHRLHRRQGDDVDECCRNDVSEVWLCWHPASGAACGARGRPQEVRRLVVAVVERVLIALLLLGVCRSCVEARRSQPGTEPPGQTCSVSHAAIASKRIPRGSGGRCWGLPDATQRPHTVAALLSRISPAVSVPSASLILAGRMLPLPRLTPVCRGQRCRPS